MLIESDRHTKADLRIWRENAAADCQHDIQRRTEKALADCFNFVGNREPCYVGVSWGKDSVVMAHLMRQASPTTVLMHLRPDNHNPDCDRVRDAYFQRFPGQPYEEVPVSYAGINRLELSRDALNKATDKRWYTAIEEYGEQFKHRHITGIRAYESSGRAMRMRRWGVESDNALAPIGWWSAADVFAYLAQNALPVHPAYAMTGDGRWKREHLRVAEIGDTCGTGNGRNEWEREYYGDVLNRMEAAKCSQK